MATILITGGNGLIGKYLSKKLKNRGYDVAILTRKRKQNTEFNNYTWDINKQEIEPEAIEKADYIIHLAGAGIGDKRWTNKRKQEIFDSRVKSGELILKKVQEQNKKLKAFISASAIGYYGAITSEKIFTENDAPANDFLGETCHKWEQTADQFAKLDIRTVKIRTGIVLTHKGGALQKMIAPVNLGIGSAIGSGKQYFPWIHIDDLCKIYIKAIEDTKMEGAYNAVATEHLTNKEFIRTLAHVINKPFWFPNIPAILMKIIFGKMSSILLTGSRISSEKIKNAGYSFQFPELEGALNDLIK